MIRNNESTMVLAIVAKGLGGAIIYCGVVTALMYPVVKAAGFLG